MKKLFFTIFTLAFVVTAALGRETQRVFEASAFGIVPNTKVNCSPLITKALATIKKQARGGQAVLRLEKGRYDFMLDGATQRVYYISNHDQDNPKTVGIAIEDMRNLTIDGGGSDFYFHGRMLPVAMLRSENCTLKNFTIDNENPQIAQVEIIENDVKKGMITYKIAPWVDYRIENGKLITKGENWELTQRSGIAFEKETKHLVYNTSDIGVGTQNVEQIADRVIRAPWANAKLVVGTVVAMRGWGRPTPGVFMSHDKNTTLENIKVHYSEGMGLLAQMSENITLDRFSVCLRGHSDPRYFTTQADATHFSGCKGVISSCDGLYENMMDDAINVHGTYLKVAKRVADNVLVGQYMHSQAYGFQWGTVGDAVQFVDSRTMELIDTVNYIVDIKPYDLPAIDGAKQYQITLKNPILDVINEKGVYGIENLEWTPKVIFSRNTIRNNRARGTLFSTPRQTLIEDNVFDHTSGTAILLCGDCNGWFETGACRDVTIRGNKFINSLTNMFQFTNAVISIYPEIPDLKNQQKYFHGGQGFPGVIIENNIFETFDTPILYAKSIDGLVFRNNKIIQNRDYPAFHWNHNRFLLERTKNVVIEGNDFVWDKDQNKDIKAVK
ncbi:MAG: right-handed parallel beta-helix repeat-containing protein [Mucinivorans sp.]